MKDAVSALEPLIQTANNKLTTMIVSAGTLAVSQTPSVKSLNEIPISEIFQHDLSALAWTMIIASAWIIFQFAREIIRGAIWLWRRYCGKN